jgi:hypothetical protein
MTNESLGSSVSLDIREVLFGDELLDKVVSRLDETTEKPWSCFAGAVQKLTAGDTQGAVAELRTVLQTNGLEARLYLQAWHSLRSLEVFPSPEEARVVQGMVVEVGLEQGLDIVAAYVDGSARYFNFSGAAIIWDIPDAEIDSLIHELLSVGQGIVDVTEPWDGPKPLAPPVGMVRINMLTFGGLHFSQGPFSTLSRDALGGLALRGAFDLMRALIEKVRARQS